MSEVAGRMALQEGAKYLESPQGGRGILLAGVHGVAPADVVILGGGVVGANAARIAAGLGANVFVLDINLARLGYLADVMPPNVITLMSNRYNLNKLVSSADPCDWLGPQNRGEGPAARHARNGFEDEGWGRHCRRIGRSGRLPGDVPSHDAFSTHLQGR